MTGILRPFVISALLAWATAVAASTLPSYYPATFNVVGTIDRLDVENGELVVSDRLLRITGDTRVHLLTRQSSSLSVLYAGMLVGCEEIIDGSGQRTATVIYELPGDFPVRGR